MIIPKLLQPVMLMYHPVRSALVQQGLTRVISPFFSACKNIHTSQRTGTWLATPIFSSVSANISRLCAPQSVTMIQTQGYKAKGKVKRRCVHCYYVLREGVKYVECKAKPRHKQFQKFALEKKLNHKF